MTDHRYPMRVRPQLPGTLRQTPRLFIERRIVPRIIPRGGLASFIPLADPESAEGDAVLVDISLQGCQLESEEIVPRDHPYQLIVFVPPHPSPILVRKAATRWSVGRIHGIHFLDLAPECERKLRDAIREGPVVSWVLSSMQFGMWSMTGLVCIAVNLALSVSVSPS
jgi:hypothetical protein